MWSPPYSATLPEVGQRHEGRCRRHPWWPEDYNENNVHGTYFQHPDGLGSVTEWSNQSGGLTVNQLFYPFGQSWVGQPGAADTTQFAGMEHRNAFQLDVTPNREYNSKWGRWLTPDPGGRNAVRLDDPQTWNAYAYVRNNPTSLTDPSGLYLMNPGSLSAIQAGEQQLAAEDEQAYLAYEFSGGATAAESSSSTGQSQQQGQSEDQGRQTEQPESTSDSSKGSGRVNSPATGDPNSIVTIPGRTPGESTERTYGPDGRVVKDIDRGHNHGVGDPHAHDWDWSKDRPRQPGRPLTPEEASNANKQMSDAANTAVKVGLWGVVGGIAIRIVITLGEAAALAF